MNPENTQLLSNGSQTPSIQQSNSLIGQWLASNEEVDIVNSYGEKKIRYFNKEDLKQVVELIARWRMLLGVTSESSDIELVVITQFIYDNYPSLSITDINFAMNWSISGKVEIGFVSQKNISSYYVSRAINAYIAEKKNIMKSIEERRNTFLAQSEDKIIEQTPIQQANTFKNIVLNLYDSHGKQKQIIDYNDIVYNWLKKTKNLCLDPAVISNAIRFGKQRVYEEKQDSVLMNKINQSLEQDRELREKKYARVFMINYFFDSIKHESELVKLIKVSDFQ
jgi:hypothetical protein